MSETESKQLCRTCNSLLPSGFFYRAHPSCCKECYKAKRKLNRDALDAKTERACTKCKVVKPKDQFYSGCRYCKDCQNENTNGNRNRKAEMDLLGIPRKCSKCKQIKAGIEAFGNGGVSYCKECYSRRRREITYNLSADEVIKVETKESCEICGTTFRKKSSRHVDHCHTTGKVRGILCTRCNTALGHMRDSISILESAIAYLKRSHKEA